MKPGKNCGGIVLIVIFTLARAVSVSAGQQFTGESVSVAQLIEEAAKHDGKEVLIEGELIGDLMARGDHLWLSLLDKGTAVGVWVDKSKLPPISFLGAYGVQGDTVQIRGIMHRACPEHGGDLDIHAEAVELLKRGGAVSHPINRLKIFAAFTLSIIGLWLVLLWRRRERGAEKAGNAR